MVDVQEVIAMRVILMCAGESMRTAPFHKLLFQVKGEPIVLRQVRMLREAGIVDLYAVVHPTVKLVDVQLPREVKRITTNADHKNNFFEFKASQPYWVGDTLVLHGDLVYSQKSLRFMLDTVKGSITVFGVPKGRKTKWCDHDEIFGVKMLGSDMEHIKTLMNRIASTITNGNHGLWNIPLKLNLPVTLVEECRDIDDSHQLKLAQKVV